MKIEIVKVQIMDSISPTPSTLQERCQTPDGVIHTGAGCLYKAARHMIGKGVRPNTRMKVFRDGKAVLIGTLDAFARKSWGGDTRDPHSRPWTPYPGEQLPPALSKWWEGVSK